MTTNRVKFLVIAVFTLLIAAAVGFKTNGLTAVLGAADDPAAVYKTKCAACHTAKAEKNFDPVLFKTSLPCLRRLE